MPYLIGFGIACFLLYMYWKFIFAIAIIIGIIWFLSEQIKKDNHAKKIVSLQEELAESDRQLFLRLEEEKNAAHISSQLRLRAELMAGCESSLKTFEVLPKDLSDAESLLDQAEVYFKEGAFAPFWDSVEKAVVRLGHFYDGVKSINREAIRYGELSMFYQDLAPTFPIAIDSVKGMVAGNSTADRMKNIVRKAQRNFQFSSIYEQRRTNKILIAGFTDLAHALDDLGVKISGSIDDLCVQVNQFSSDISASISNVGEQFVTANQRLSESIQELHAAVENEAMNQAERHDRALDMLDNIQRRRMPSDFSTKKFTHRPVP